MVSAVAHSPVRVVALVLMALAGAACGYAPAPATPTNSPTPVLADGVVVTRLKGPPGEIAQVAWVGDSLILQVLDGAAAETGDPWSSRLWQLPLSRMALRELPIAYDRACGTAARHAIESPVRVNDHILMYMQRCARLDANGQPSAYHAATLMSFDLLTQRAPAAEADRVDVPVSPPLNAEVNGIFIDRATGMVTVVEPSDPEHNHVSPMAGGAARYLDGGGLSIWGLSSAPDGRAAFIGRAAGGGEPGTGKASLYVADGPELARPREVLAGVQDLTGTAWSNDGQWVAFGGKFKGGYGLYVVRVETQEVRLVAEGRYWPTGSAWAPVGERIAQPYELPDGTWEIHILDVAALLAR